MKKIKIGFSMTLVMFFILIPGIDLVMQNEDMKLNAYTEIEMSFEEFLTSRGMMANDTFYINYDDTSHSIPNVVSGVSNVIINGTIEAPYCTTSCYPTHTYWFNYYTDPPYYGIAFFDGYEQTTLILWGDGTITDDYFFYTNTSISFDLSSPDVTYADFYGAIFFQNPYYTYDISDLSITEVQGWEYDKDNDDNGHSAYEIGEAVFTQGFLGWLPRITSEDSWSIPMIEYAVTFTGMVFNVAGQALATSTMRWLDVDVVGNETFSYDFWSIGDWNETDIIFDNTVYTYVVEDAGFWGGTRIEATVTHEGEDNEIVAYKKQSKKFWGWSDVLRPFLDDEDMLAYKISTNNFE